MSERKEPKRSYTEHEKARIAAIRGAGISFALASLLFVFTWAWWVFLLIPVGALVGFALSRRPERERTKRPMPTSSSAIARVGRWVQHQLLHPNLLLRFAGLFTLAVLLFVLAWLIGYYLLPEGALRAAGAEQLARGGLDVTAEGVGEEWGRIFTYNLVPLILIVLANLVLRVNGVPLGYIVPLYNVVGYGAFIGTNSFVIPYPERLAPTFAILERSGPYEMTALLIVAAATATWSHYQVRSIFHTNPEPVEPRPRIALTHLVFLALGVALLAVANLIEAAMITAL